MLVMFDSMAIQHQPNGETVLVGELPDEAALHSVLLKVRDLGLPLLSVRRLQRPPRRSARGPKG